MTYQEFIQGIINTRGRFGIAKGEYKERHHILPRCMGGLDNKDNLIDLTAQEHYEAHKLLFKENPINKGLALAWFNFSIRKPSKNTPQIHISANDYAQLKNELSKCLSDSLLGHKDFRTPEQAFLASQKGGRNSKGIKRNFTNPEDHNKKLSEVGKTKIGELNNFYGHHHSEESKILMSIRKKELGSVVGGKNGRAKPVKCVELNKIFSCIKDAASEFNLERHLIRFCCQGKLDLAGGYHWEYVDKEVFTNAG